MRSFKALNLVPERVNLLSAVGLYILQRREFINTLSFIKKLDVKPFLIKKITFGPYMNMKLENSLFLQVLKMEWYMMDAIAEIAI